MRVYGDARRILLAGAGGGYDIMGAIPLVADLPIVAQQHLFLDGLAATDSIWEVSARIEAARTSLAIRDRTSIPI